MTQRPWDGLRHSKSPCAPATGWAGVLGSCLRHRWLERRCLSRRRPRDRRPVTPAKPNPYAHDLAEGFLSFSAAPVANVSQAHARSAPVRRPGSRQVTDIVQTSPPFSMLGRFQNAGDGEWPRDRRAARRCAAGIVRRLTHLWPRLRAKLALDRPKNLLVPALMAKTVSPIA